MVASIARQHSGVLSGASITIKREECSSGSPHHYPRNRHHQSCELPERFPVWQSLSAKFCARWVCNFMLTRRSQYKSQALVNPICEVAISKQTVHCDWTKRQTNKQKMPHIWWTGCLTSSFQLHFQRADDVFLEVEPIIRSALDGHNVCIFAYGQTGTGKTFTMVFLLPAPQRHCLCVKTFCMLFVLFFSMWMS